MARVRGSRSLGTTKRGAIALAVAAAFMVPPVALSAQEGGEQDGLGKEVYDTWCAGCHGVDGAGEGPGAGQMLPRPRDFTRALYQIRTTASGELPTDEDILHVIDVGMPGTAMPGWEDLLSQSERDALVDYLKTFSRFFTPDEQPTPLDFGKAPSANADRIARGAELYQEIECWQCHGQAGRGDGTSSPTLSEDNGSPIFVADLTTNWRFNGGGEVEDIYRVLRTGLDGTPMATFSDLVESGIITDDDLWSLAHYVRSLSPRKAPEVGEVIVASQVEGEAPTDPGDPRWAEADRFFIPMVGQVVVAPRWFNPRVSNLWVQALHDGESLSMRLTWTDPSASPNPEWAEFAQQVHDAMEPKEDTTWAPGAPDRLVVQFPQVPTEGMERPFFLQGDDRRPAYLWTWESQGSAAGLLREQISRGLGTAQDQAPESVQLTGSSVHFEGGWQVVMRRSLVTEDATTDLQFTTGQSIPVAFQAWDGDNAETGGRAAVSSWFFVHLQEPTPLTAYVSPFVVLILTAIAGMYMIRQARRKAEETQSNMGEA